MRARLAAGSKWTWASGIAILCFSGLTSAADVLDAKPCDPAAKQPTLTSTAQATIPEPIWIRRIGWTANVQFRLDESGAPVSIYATALAPNDDDKELERISAETLARYRFCLPQDYVSLDRWSANVGFRHMKSMGIYVQSFVPRYNRDDIANLRQGQVVVRGLFNPDGRAASVSVAKSSGDPMLDEKAMQSMRLYQFAFRDGAGLPRPLWFEQPFNFEL